MEVTHYPNGDVIHSPVKVSVLVIEEGDSPLQNIIHLKNVYRIGADVGPVKDTCLLTMAETNLDGRNETDAAHEVALEWFGAEGYCYKLGEVYTSPSQTTEINALFAMSVVSFQDEKVEGISYTLQQALNMTKTPYNIIDASLATAILMYAAKVGV